MELCVEGFALSENFVIRCDKFVFINFVIIHCTQYEVPFARLRKYFMLFSPSLYHLILHLENFPWCAVSLSPLVRLWEVKEKRGRGNKSTVNQDHSWEQRIKKTDQSIYVLSAFRWAVRSVATIKPNTLFLSIF